MPFPKQDKHGFTLSKISKVQPNQAGVYGIFNHAGCIYIEKAKDIRESLLLHVSQQSEQSQCIFGHDPQYWLALVVDRSQLFTWERILCREFAPHCLTQTTSTAQKPP
jgi:hypothetical protein